MDRRGFIQLFFAASAVIVATPRALVEDTSGDLSTALTVAGPEWLPENWFMWRMAGHYAGLAMEITSAAQIPARYLWGDRGVPTQVDYYKLLMREGDTASSLADVWQMKEEQYNGLPRAIHEGPLTMDSMEELKC